MNDFMSIKKEEHSVSCACELQVDWNISCISGSGCANGFIVQDYKRIQIPTNILGVSNYTDIHYFEAWCVKNGHIISEDRGENCDDLFKIGNQFTFFSDFKNSVNTNGKFEFTGKIYWIPEESHLYEIVNQWKRSDVEQAGGLKAAYYFPEIEGVDYIFERTPFIHSWNLIGEERIYNEAKKIIFKFCHNNTEEDKKLLTSRIHDLLSEKYNHLIVKIIDEWKQQWAE